MTHSDAIRLIFMEVFDDAFFVFVFVLDDEEELPEELLFFEDTAVLPAVAVLPVFTFESEPGLFRI